MPMTCPATLLAYVICPQAAGYDLGDLPQGEGALQGLGEALLQALKGQEEPRTVSRGIEGGEQVKDVLRFIALWFFWGFAEVLKCLQLHTAVRADMCHAWVMPPDIAGIKALGAGPAAKWGVQPAAAEVGPQLLRDMLTFPPTWGPTEWGPIPYLPDDDTLVKRMESQWGTLSSYRGINSTTRGTLLVPGVQLGKLWIGVQPLLGLEGDPMRLLFERDLTPHPQYAAAYKWLQQVRA